jgi:hypothetical protein
MLISDILATAVLKIDAAGARAATSEISCPKKADRRQKQWEMMMNRIEPAPTTGPHLRFAYPKSETPGCRAIAHSHSRKRNCPKYGAARQTAALRR